MFQKNLFISLTTFEKLICFIIKNSEVDSVQKIIQDIHSSRSEKPVHFLKNENDPLNLKVVFFCVTSMQCALRSFFS